MFFGASDLYRDIIVISVLVPISGLGILRIFQHLRIFWGVANAGLGMGTYQLHVIACNLDLRRVGMKLNLRFHSTNCWVFFFKICHHPCKLKIKISLKIKFIEYFLSRDIIWK